MIFSTRRNKPAPLVFGANWTYTVPFAHTKSRILNQAVSGWKVNGLLRYNSGSPISIAGGAGNLGSVGYGQYGNAVLGVSPYKTTDPSDFDPATSVYLNSAAFTTSTGFNFGTLGPNPSWIRGFWGKSESLTVGRIFKIRERFVFDFSADATNPFNFVRWGGPNTSLVSAAFGKVTSAQAGRTMQINGTVRF